MLKLLGALALAVGAARAFNGRATFYDAGLGACGGWNTASDYIVALNVGQYGGGCSGTAHCGEKLTITFGDTSVVATVADCCPGCGYGDLDMTRGLFNRFADASAGVFYMSWQWGAGNDPPPTTRATSTWVQPRTTSTWTPTTTSQTTSQATSSRQSSSQQQPSASRSAPAALPSVRPNNLVDVNAVLLQMANLIGQSVAQS